MHLWWIRNNLSFLARYWYTATVALKRVSEAPETFEEFEMNGVERPYVDAVISSHLDHHNYAALLLVFANFEEFFSVLCGELGKVLGVTVEPNDLKDRGVQRFRKFIHKVCQVGDHDLQIDWSFLEQFAVVRNCLVHANGNRGRLADPKALDRVVAVYPNELSYLHQVKLRIFDEFVRRAIRETERASLAIVRYLNTQSNQGMQPTGKADGLLPALSLT
jgi:hypothetical protein